MYVNGLQPNKKTEIKNVEKKNIILNKHLNKL